MRRTENEARLHNYLQRQAKEAKNLGRLPSTDLHQLLLLNLKEAGQDDEVFKSLPREISELSLDELRGVWGRIKQKNNQSINN